MPFDIRGARAAGYTDPEIMAFLKKPLAQPLPPPADDSTFDVKGARSAGYTDAEITAFLKKGRQSTQTLSTPGDYSIPGPAGRAPAPPARPQPFVGPRAPMAVPPPESTLPGTMQRIGASGYSGPQVTGGPIQIGAPPDAGNLVSGIEDIQGSGERRALGASQLGRFGMEASAPILGPAAAARPLSTLMGLGYGMAAAHGTEAGLRGIGVAPGYAQLAGDVAGLGAGVATSLAPWERFAKPGAFPEFVRNELGEIVIRPSQGWTSTLRDLIEQKVPAKVQPQQLRGILSQASPEEVKWTGMGRLAEAAQEPLAKQDILGQLSGQPPQERPLPPGWESKSLLDILQGPNKPLPNLPKVGPLEIREVLLTGEDTKPGWRDLVLPGGKGSTNELLLTLPDTEKLRMDAINREIDILATHRPSAETAHRIDQLNTEYNELARGKGRFTGGHYREYPNVFAHTRYNERMTPQGEPVLFLEEVQSDWHQKGRKEGYGSSDYKQQIEAAMRAATDAFAEWKNMAELHGPEHELAQAAKLKHQELSRRAAQIVPSGTVPDAPFKKDWHELVIKRMIGEAIDKGAKKLAWTTGEQQAERYDLSKHIDRLEYNPRSRYLEAWDPQGKQVIREEGINPEQLPEYIGQDAAKKLQQQIDAFDTDFVTADDFGVNFNLDRKGFVITNPNGYEFFRPDGSGWPTAGDAYREVYRRIDEHNLRRDFPSLSGLDLKTGGEGMKGFYDKILPDFARKYGKKFGATVSQTEIQTPEGPVKVHSLDITPEMRRALREGQPMFGTQVSPPKQQELPFTAPVAPAPKPAPKKGALLQLPNRSGTPVAVARALFDAEKRRRLALA